MNRRTIVESSAMINRRSFFSGIRDDAARARDYWVHLHRRAMACRFEITLPSSRRPPDRSDLSAAQVALDIIDRMEDQLSIFRETSEVSFINRSAYAGEVRVEPDLFELLALCRELYETTDGAFDVTSGPLSRCWGFVSRQGRTPGLQELEDALASVGMSGVTLNRINCSVRFERNGIEINLGSIGKGFALDRAAEHLRKEGVKSALLTGGNSSMLAIGRRWLVGIRHPVRKDKRLARVRLSNCAMGTSGAGEQYFERDGKRYGHVIDPRSGRPAQTVAAVTVITTTAALADALATAFFVGGRALAEKFCSNRTGVLVLLSELTDPDRIVAIGSSDGCEVL